MGSKLSFKWNLDDIYDCKEYLLYIVYFILNFICHSGSSEENNNKIQQNKRTYDLKKAKKSIGLI